MSIPPAYEDFDLRGLHGGRREMSLILVVVVVVGLW